MEREHEERGMLLVEKFKTMPLKEHVNNLLKNYEKKIGTEEEEFLYNIYKQNKDQTEKEFFHMKSEHPKSDYLKYYKMEMDLYEKVFQNIPEKKEKELPITEKEEKEKGEEKEEKEDEEEFKMKKSIYETLLEDHYHILIIGLGIMFIGTLYFFNDPIKFYY